MRIKVWVDTRQPLKTHKKVVLKSGGSSVVKFKYERLGVFCFICGCIGHSERSCNKMVEGSLDAQNKLWAVWGPWLRSCVQASFG